jgi:hypothetical protein
MGRADIKNDMLFLQSISGKHNQTPKESISICRQKNRPFVLYLWLDSACFSLRHKGFGGSSLSVAKEAKIL